MSQKAKILLIDDDALVTDSLRRVLEGKGYTVDAVNNPEEGIRKAENQTYNLIISDIRMPCLNGIEVIEAIKSSNERNGKPCAYMIITGFADDDVPAHANRLGISDFLLKPFDVMRFLKAVDDELNGSISSLQKVSQDQTGAPKSLIGKWKFPDRKFVFEKLVLLKNTNIMGNTYYDNYVTWQGEGRERLLLSHPSVQEFLENSKHIKMITHSIYHRFITETTFGDLVRCEVTSREIKQCSTIMVFRFFNVKNNAILGEGWQRVCFMDLRMNKLCPVPQLILDLIEPIRDDAVKK